MASYCNSGSSSIVRFSLYREITKKKMLASDSTMCSYRKVVEEILRSSDAMISFFSYGREEFEKGSR